MLFRQQYDVVRILFVDFQNPRIYGVFIGVSLVCVTFSGVTLLTLLYQQLNPNSVDSVWCLRTISIIVGICQLIFVIDLTQMKDHKNDWGPILQPYGNKQFLVSWFTSDKTTSKYTLNDDNLVFSDMDNFHQLVIENGDSFSSNGKSLNYQIPDVVQKVLVISDIHGNDKSLQQIVSLPVDLIISPGDLTKQGFAYDYKKIFDKITKPFMFATGDSDDVHSKVEQIRGRGHYFYQKVASNIGIVVSFSDSTSSFSALLEEMEASDVHNVFLVIHKPLFSTGPGGSNAEFALLLEEHMKKYENSRLRAIFSGDDHVFSHFKLPFGKSGVMSFVILSGGEDELARTPQFALPEQQALTSIDEVKGGFEVVGPLAEGESRRHGWQSHVQSLVYPGMVVGMIIELHPDKIIYQLIDLTDIHVITTFEQALM